MNKIFDALSNGFRDLFQLKVLWIMIWPMLLAMLLWTIVVISLWGPISSLIEAGLTRIGLQEWLTGLQTEWFSWLAHAIQATIHFIVFIPLVFLTALLITAIFAMPALVRLVAAQHYPNLVAQNGGSILGNLGNALYALTVFLLIWIVTLPLWFIWLGALVPLIAASYLNQRLFRYDAIANHASADEMKTLFKQYRAHWWGLGLLIGLLQFIPFVNLIAPVITALAFIHFGLARIQEQRQADLSLNMNDSNIAAK